MIMKKKLKLRCFYFSAKKKGTNSIIFISTLQQRMSFSIVLFFDLKTCNFRKHIDFNRSGCSVFSLVLENKFFLSLTKWRTQIDELFSFALTRIHKVTQWSSCMSGCRTYIGSTMTTNYYDDGGGGGKVSFSLPCSFVGSADSRESLDNRTRNYITKRL